MTVINHYIVKFIINYYKKHQFYPNYDEIAKDIHCAKSTVHTYMKELEKEGIIVRQADASSQYRLINMGFIQRDKSITLLAKPDKRKDG